jgi:hypothetical protein
MKIRNTGLIWAIVLLVTGLFLLLKNLGVFGQWGDAAWGGLFAVIGIGFLVWFVLGVQQWWRAIPGFMLVSIGVLVLLDWRGIKLGDWRSALPLFGIALGFWTVLLVHTENWWALIPAGTMTLLGLLVGLQARLGGAGSNGWLAVLFVGLGTVFGALYFLRLGGISTRWSAIPALALILVGLTTLSTTAGDLQNVVRWWPVLLLIAGLGLLVGSIQRQAAPSVQVPPTPRFDDIPPARGASIYENLPKNVPPAPRLAPAPQKQVDIYEFLRQQPAGPSSGSEPPAPEPGEKPPAGAQ